MASRKRVAVVITGLGIGGTELALLRLVSNLDMAMYEVDVICLYDEDNRLEPRFRELGVNVVVMKLFDYTRPSFFRFDGRMFLRMIRRMRRERYDLVHTFLPHADRAGGMAAQLAGVRGRIATLCDMPPGPRRKSAIALDRYLGRRAHTIVGKSRAICDWDRAITGLPADKYRVIYNGIDVERFDPTRVGARKSDVMNLPDDSVVIGSIGRLTKQKAFDDLIEAFSMLNPADRNLRLVIVGDGMERRFLEERARACDVSECVAFLGFRDDTPEILSCFDVFVSSSLHEGFPNVLLEALGMELPVVATGLPPVREIITSGVNGFLVPPHDPQRLGAAIERLLQDRAAGATMGSRGRHDVVERFSHVKMVKEYAGLYAEVLGERRSRTS